MTLLEIYREAKLTQDEIGEMPEHIANGDAFYDSSAYEKLFEHFAFDTGEMPYGTAKARDGDPDVWILERLEKAND